MSWTLSEKQRKPQQVVECPPGFEGNSRYISTSEVDKGTLPNYRPRRRKRKPKINKYPRMLFGEHRGKPLNVIPVNYLRWAETVIRNQKFKQSIQHELNRRGAK